MKCKICLVSKADLYKLREKILGVSIHELIVDTARVEIPKGARSHVCFECCVALHNTRSFIKKVQNCYLPVQKAVAEKRQSSDKNATETTPKKHKGNTSDVGVSETDCSRLEESVVVKKKKNKSSENVSSMNGNETVLQTPTPAQTPSITSTPNPATTPAPTPLKEKKLSNQTKSPCVSCGKKFLDLGKLEIHMRKVHKKPETFDCPNCGVYFRSKEKYDSHVFSEKCTSSIYPCQEASCNKRFSNMKTMQLHMTKFHPLSIYCTSNGNEI